MRPYKGLCPSNIGKDAKYSMSVAGEVRVPYRIDARTRNLLTTDVVECATGGGPGRVKE